MNLMTLFIFTTILEMIDRVIQPIRNSLFHLFKRFIISIV